MKITRAEKIWLAVTVFFYLMYNLPGVPPYGEAIPTMVHALLTILPLWITAYAGMYKIYKIYRLRRNKEG